MQYAVYASENQHHPEYFNNSEVTGDWYICFTLYLF